MAVFFPTHAAVYEVTYLPNGHESVACPTGDDRAKQKAKLGYAWARDRRAQAELDDSRATGVLHHIDEYCQTALDGGPKLLVQRFAKEPHAELVDTSLEAAVAFGFLFYSAKGRVRGWDDHFAVSAEIERSGKLLPVEMLEEKYRTLSRWAQDAGRRVRFLYASSGWTAPKADDPEFSPQVEAIHVSDVKDLFRQLVTSISNYEDANRAAAPSSFSSLPPPSAASSDTQARHTGDRRLIRLGLSLLLVAILSGWAAYSLQAPVNPREIADAGAPSPSAPSGAPSASQRPIASTADAAPQREPVLTTSTASATAVPFVSSSRPRTPRKPPKSIPTKDVGF